MDQEIILISSPINIAFCLFFLLKNSAMIGISINKVISNFKARTIFYCRFSGVKGLPYRILYTMIFILPRIR